MEGFARLSKLARTPPPRRSRVNSLPDKMDTDSESFTKKERNRRQPLALDTRGTMLCSAPTSPVRDTSVFESTWCRGEEKTSKRRRDDLKPSTRERQGAAGEQIATRVRRLIEKMQKEIRTVVEMAKERNTKKEIKEAASALRTLISQLTAEGVCSIREHTEKNRELKGQNEALKKEMETKLRAAIKSVEPRKEMDVESFNGCGSYEHFGKVERLAWPNNIFKAAFYATGSPLQTNRGTDLVMLKEEGQHDNVGMERAFMDRYPELQDISSKVAAISVTTKTVKGENNGERLERWILRMEIKNEEKDYFESLVELRELLKKGGEQKWLYTFLQMTPEELKQERC